MPNNGHEAVKKGLASRFDRLRAYVLRLNEGRLAGVHDCGLTNHLQWPAKLAKFIELADM